MTILLPASPRPKSFAIRPVVFGGVQEGALGGPSITISRMGDRFAVDAQTPNLRFEPDTLIWTSRLLRGLAEGVAIAVPQPGLANDDPGTGTVYDGNRTGTSLPVQGLRPGYTIFEGQFLSILVGGRRYLHQAAADRGVDAAGRSVLAIWPMLRVIVPEGSPVSFAPVIEGTLSGFDSGWTLVKARTNGLAFTITEKG